MGKIVDIQEEDTQELHMEEEEEMLTHTQRAVILKWHWRKHCQGIVTRHQLWEAKFNKF